MKSQTYLESLFANSRCDSQFAYFCLFCLLSFLFYTFAEGVLEELSIKEEEQLRKEQNRRPSSQQQNTVQPISQPSISPQVQLKDFSELQKEQALGQELFDLMAKEELSMDGYSTVVLQNREMNAACLLKGDSNLRLDAMVEVSSRSIFEAIYAHDKTEIWFNTDEWKCLGVKVVDNFKSGSDLFCMTVQTPKGKFDFVFRRFVKNTEQRQSYNIILTSQGLDNLKLKTVTNKRLFIDCWGFRLSQMGVNPFDENETPTEQTIVQQEEEDPHAKVFCFLQSKQKDMLKEVMAPLMMKLLEYAVISID